MCLSGLHGGIGGIDDMFRRSEIRLPEAEIEYRYAFGFEFPGFGPRRQRRRRFHGPSQFRDSQHTRFASTSSLKSYRIRGLAEVLPCTSRNSCTAILPPAAALKRTR